MPSSNSATEQAMLDQLSLVFTRMPFNKMLGLTLVDLKPDHAVMQFTMKEDLIGNFLHGILHGGVISSVLDMAGGMVVMASLIHHHPELPPLKLAEMLGKCSTVDLQISYLRPGKGEHFIAKAALIKYGNSVSFTRMELLNNKETLIASGTGTYISHS